MRPRLGLPTQVGLVLALVVPGLLAELFKHVFGPTPAWPVNVLGQLAQWGLLAALVALCVFWERQPVASMGLRPPRRDLAACMIAHAIGDGVGMVILPLLRGH